MSLTGYHGDFDEERTRQAWKQIAAACRQARNGHHRHRRHHRRQRCIQSRIYSTEGRLSARMKRSSPLKKIGNGAVRAKLRLFEHRD